MNNNPYINVDKDRKEIWDMVVKRDIKAFVNQDWEMIKADFQEEEFMGIDARKKGDPDQWKLSFPNLESYKTEWLNQAKDFNNIRWAEDVSEALHRITVLQDIEINGKAALLHKKFIGAVKKENGEYLQTDWQTLYRCKKINNRWKIVGFTGYMPLVKNEITSDNLPAKRLPENAGQHETAGPYSPVLVVDPGKLVVISGQAAIDTKGNVIGDTIEDQTAYTLDNCRIQLASAGCSLDDVFKVNVYVTDLKMWPRFNEVYKNYFKDPKPVRTALQTGLLMNLLVEIEMWAVIKGIKPQGIPYSYRD